MTFFLVSRLAQWSGTRICLLEEDDHLLLEDEDVLLPEETEDLLLPEGDLLFTEELQKKNIYWATPSAAGPPTFDYILIVH